ncbi:MAG: imidazole glycerol phosphate synthase subunit HisH, partial [Candidatus Acidiferrales bacterium]
MPSVERAFQRLGAQTRRAFLPEDLQVATALVLPGVGHFGALARALRERNLAPCLRTALEHGTPFLGICLGMQALYEASVEAAGEQGLGVFSGAVGSLPTGVKLPHMGWNQLRAVRASHLLRGLSPEAYFYFAHSYAVASSGGEAAAFCRYGIEFTAVVEQVNVFAVQFHPEKSGEAGALVLRNFLEC